MKPSSEVLSFCFLDKPDVTRGAPHHEEQFYPSALHQGCAVWQLWHKAARVADGCCR